MESMITRRAASVIRGRDEVYVAAVPLTATKGPPQLLLSSAYSLNFWDLHHFFVILKSSPSSQAIVFDFQPKDPENIYTAVAVLCGGSVPGMIRVRRMEKMPRRKCWYVGRSEGEGVEVATKFSDGWDTNLRIGHHDCRHYTNGLVELLTGEKQVLKRLRSSNLSLGN